MATPTDAMNAIEGLFGCHPRYRALHAKGFLVRGEFHASPDAAALTKAAHMQGGTVPALVRFSNGSGKPDEPDYRPMVRGMAVKLTLPDGSRTDISAQTARLFSSATPDAFIELLRSVSPRPSSLWRLPWFLVRHPALIRSGPSNAQLLRIPASYATCSYHALHAYRWVDASGGSRFVRYHWNPHAGESFLAPWTARRQSGDFLREELLQRLETRPIRFDLDVEIAGPGDSTTDPSARWRRSTRTTVGVLEITALETERETGSDVVVFDPMRVTDGIEPSDDPVLRFRSVAYSASVERRTGVPRGDEAPPLP
jgi:catalase